MASARAKARIEVMLFMVVFPYVVTVLEWLQRIGAPAVTSDLRGLALGPGRRPFNLRVAATAEEGAAATASPNLRRRSRVPEKLGTRPYQPSIERQ